MTAFDNLELAVMRRAPLTQEEKENARALRVLSETAAPVRSRVAMALYNLSQRLDPSVSANSTPLAAN